jgi:hypothetical protein
MKTFCRYIQESEQESKPNVGRMKKAKPVELNIEGPTGFKIVGYQWSWKEDSVQLKSGVVVPTKISDWEGSMKSEHTKRDIVHVFEVESDDKSTRKMMSLESAMKVLGYMTLTKATPAVIRSRNCCVDS